MTISHSVTIDCSGVNGSTTRTGANGFIINGPGISVTIRGLIIHSILPGQFSGPGAIGIDIQAAASVTIEDCTIRNFTTQGVFDRRGSAGKLIIKNTFIGGISNGPAVAVAGPSRNYVVLDNVTAVGNKYGVAVATGNTGIISGSTLSGNSVSGVQADSLAQVVVDRSTIDHNNIGVTGNAAVRLSNNNIVFNSTALSGGTGTFGNNRFSGNSAMGTAPTPLGNASSDFAQQ